MDTINLQRQQIVRNAVLQRPDAIVATSLYLWQRLSQELILIIGEGGFQSMYFRSLHLAAVRFPWLPLPPAGPLMRKSAAPVALSVPSSAGSAALSRFAVLVASLEAQALEQAAEASIALLCTFIDILAMLIGEHLTTSILHAAWGNAALAEKESQ